MISTDTIAEHEHEPGAHGPSDAAQRAVPTSARAVAVGILGIALTCVLVTWAELVISTIKIGYLQLPPVSIAVLILALAVTRGTSRLLQGRWRFNAAELATVYVMSLMGAMVASHGMTQKLLPLLVVPSYFGNASNDWRHLYLDHVPRWLVPFDPQGAARQPVASWYFESLPRGAGIPWLAWIGPLVIWSLFLGLIFFAFLCLTAILRRQWVDNEKLAFPLAQLPLEIIGGDPNQPGFFSRPLVWLGAAMPIALYGIDWAHMSAPMIPLIPTSLSLNDYLVNPPWNGIGYTPIIFSFAAIGFFYLLPTDILFSLWFFFLLDRFEQGMGDQYNWDMPSMPTNWLPVFQGYQTIGAYVALAIGMMILARPHLRRVWDAAIGPGGVPEGDTEILPYKTAFWGLALSLLGSCLMLCLMGMSWWLAVFEIGTVVFLIAVVMARSTAEAGLLMSETTFQPYDLYKIGGSLHGLGGANLTLLAFVDHLLSHDQRGLLLTGMLDSSYLGDRVRLRRRSLAFVIALGVVVAAAIAIPLQLAVTYHLGALRMDSWMMQGSPQVQFKVNAGAIMTDEPARGGWQMPVFFIVGLVVTFCLTALRTRFFWWPLHPLGYALAGSQSTIEFWFPCLLAWALKSLTLRYGGHVLYHKARPFFLGLIVGEFMMAVVTSCLNVACHVPAPPFPWQ